MALVFGKGRKKLLWKNVGKPRIVLKLLPTKIVQRFPFKFMSIKTLPVQNLIVFKFKEFVIQKKLVVKELYVFIELEV